MPLPNQPKVEPKQVPGQQQQQSSADPAMTEVQAQLQKIQQQVVQGQQVQTLLNQPEVSQVIQLLNQGKKIKVVEDTGEPQQQVPSSQADVDEMTNKELVGHILGQVSNQLKSVVKESISPLVDRQQVIADYLQKDRLSKAEQEIAALSKQYSDFGQLESEMLKVRQENPGLGIEELYVIAKGRKTGFRPAQGMFSEKPNSVSTPPPEINPATFGKRGAAMGNLVAQGLQQAIHSIQNAKGGDVEI